MIEFEYGLARRAMHRPDARRFLRKRGTRLFRAELSGC